MGPTVGRRTVASLRSPQVLGQMSAEPPAPDMPVAVTETHISVLFYVGERVYKLRKPVHFDFLDFRTREARLRDCEREVALNRRLSPDVYLGVADLRLNGDFIDHMVVMRRLPESRNLAVLARRGEDLDEPLGQVARMIALFHSTAERSPAISSEATPDALRDGWETNFAEAQQFVGTMLDGAADAEIRSLARRWTDGHETLLNERIAEGHVCDGHGDLLAGDIFVLDDGVRILDCIEFDDRLRCCDVIADVAFLAMDLERLGRAGAAKLFLRLYGESSGDPMPGSLAHFYCASRAYVRAKVCCLRASQGVDGARTEARGLQALALSHLRSARERLVLVGGLPGSGKSTLAAGLGAARGWPVLRSDEIRREHGRTVQGRFAEGQRIRCPADRYSAEATGAVYRELLRRAERHLGSGRSVVLDASWVDSSWRDRARSVADRTMSDLVELHCESTPEEADRRIRRRLSERTNVSDATPEVRRAMSARMDPWASALAIETSEASPSEALDAALQACPDWFDFRRSADDRADGWSEPATEDVWPYR